MIYARNSLWAVHTSNVWYMHARNSLWAVHASNICDMWYVIYIKWYMHAHNGQWAVHASNIWYMIYACMHAIACEQYMHLKCDIWYMHACNSLWAVHACALTCHNRVYWHTAPRHVFCTHLIHDICMHAIKWGGLSWCTTPIFVSIAYTVNNNQCWRTLTQHAHTREAFKHTKQKCIKSHSWDECAKDKMD